MRRYGAAILGFLMLATCLGFKMPGHIDDEDEEEAGNSTVAELKNRTQPPAHYQAMTLAEILTLGHICPDDEQTQKLNRRGVIVEGYLVAAVKRSDGNSYGFPAADGDIHLHLAQDGGNLFFGPGVVVAEATPPFQHRHKSWNVDELKKYSSYYSEHGFQHIHAGEQSAARVRLSGWLMADHGCSQIPFFRGTLWEIHPVTRIEIWQDDGWRELR